MANLMKVTIQNKIKTSITMKTKSQKLSGLSLKKNMTSLGKEPDSGGSKGPKRSGSVLKNQDLTERSTHFYDPVHLDVTIEDSDRDSILMVEDSNRLEKLEKKKEFEMMIDQMRYRKALEEQAKLRREKLQAKTKKKQHIVQENLGPE